MVSVHGARGAALDHRIQGAALDHRADASRRARSPGIPGNIRRHTESKVTKAARNASPSRGPTVRRKRGPGMLPRPSLVLSLDQARAFTRPLPCTLMVPVTASLSTSAPRRAARTSANEVP